MQESTTIIDQLQAGTVRAATYSAEHGWQPDQSVKSAILSTFRAGENISCSGIYEGFVDKHNILPQKLTVADQVRMVPGGSAIRRGAYVAPGVIIMPPSYINIGAYVAGGSMVDSHVLVGTCAQIGQNVHLSAGVQIGGVLEPIGAHPVIIEDNVFIGAGASVLEGILVRRNAVIAAGVALSRSVRLYDCINEQQLDITRGIPENAVVVSGTRPVNSDWGARQGLQISCALIVKYRDDKSEQSLALEEALR